jgi:hypothetical protein
MTGSGPPEGEAVDGSGPDDGTASLSGSVAVDRSSARESGARESVESDASDDVHPAVAAPHASTNSAAADRTDS